MNNDDKGHLLTALARAAIARKFGIETATLPHPAWLEEPGAVFVTLTRDGQLRGCIGSLEAQRALGRDIESNAQAAAFRDQRFPALEQQELDLIRIEVSVLSKPEAMHFTNEVDALAQLRPGIDGVILQSGWHRATFLPQVWEQLPEPSRFMAHLKIKAGLPADFWSDSVKLSRYAVAKYEESP
jgi:AmmeMemoRadiSam system protein A